MSVSKNRTLPRLTTWMQRIRKRGFRVTFPQGSDLPAAGAILFTNGV
jgi:hypothetical protein